MRAPQFQLGSYKVYVCASANPLAPFQQPNTYTGTFTYNETAVSSGCPANFTPTLPAAPKDAGPKIGYENFEAPGQLTTITQTSSGAYTVEYLGPQRSRALNRCKLENRSG